jgi:hypothetical protein
MHVSLEKPLCLGLFIFFYGENDLFSTFIFLKKKIKADNTSPLEVGDASFAFPHILATIMAKNQG